MIANVYDDGNKKGSNNGYKIQFYPDNFDASLYLKWIS